jgi:F-type H+-transporting ATPase subunit epsilon
MQVEIISPDKNLYEGEAKYVGLPGTAGNFGILNNHAPMISTLREGQVVLRKEDNSEELFDIKGGVIEVLKNKVIILAE